MPGRRDKARAELEERIAGLEQRIAGLEASRLELWASASDLQAGVKLAEDRIAELVAAGDPLAASFDDLARRSALLLDVVATTAWVGVLPPSPALVSVIVPTCNRAELLAGAIASVRTQTHQAWELVVVDHGSEDGTAALVEGVGDERVRLVRVAHEPGQGPATPLNAGLEAARGELIAYLDDDNLMQPLWLAGVVWAFGAHPEADVLYGARVLEPVRDGPPELLLQPWDARRMEVENLTDQNVLAHRASIAARYDESHTHAADWEFALRVTAEKEPLRLPLVAVGYRRHAPDRRSDDAGALASAAAVQELALRRRPLRVLGFNAMFPLITETYIHDELAALEPHGVQLAWCREHDVPVPMAVRQPVYDRLEQAIADFAPDVLFLHWATFAVEQLERLERIGLPFAVRIHSFDALDELAAPLREHPLCAGVWSYPSKGHEALGTHHLTPILSSLGAIPEPAPERDTVMSVSAGLPKKDWPLLLEAMGALGGVRRRVVIGQTLGHEDEPAEVAATAAAMDDGPLVEINVPREEVFRMLSRSALLVYSLAPEVRFGMPMSVVEGLAAGCCVVMPDRPECRDYAGPGFRAYTTAADIARHAREALAGGPAIEAEREANRAYARERFAAPELGARFHEELLSGLDRVRAARLV